MNGEDAVHEIAKMVGGTVNEMGRLPDGSGFATMSFPLPKNHWIYQKNDDGFNFPPPMPFRMGSTPEVHQIEITREQFAEKIRLAGRYAVRASTMNGAEMDFDPDAMLQNLVVGMLGYFTGDGLTTDKWANPKEPPQG